MTDLLDFNMIKEYGSDWKSIIQAQIGGDYSVKAVRLLIDERACPKQSYINAVFNVFSLPEIYLPECQSIVIYEKTEMEASLYVITTYHSS